jgi:hypothetical protein
MESALRADSSALQIRLESGGRHSVRVWNEQGGLRWLIAGFNTGGGEPFFSAHFEDERKPLKPGNVIGDSFRICPCGGGARNAMRPAISGTMPTYAPPPAPVSVSTATPASQPPQQPPKKDLPVQRLLKKVYGVK